MEIELKERKSPKRLIVDVPEDWHHLIKLKAIEANMTLRHWVLQTLMLRIKQEEVLNKNEN